MKPTAAWLSVTGSVFGIAHTAVNPPAAAARVPLAIVSTSSFPGSRRCTCTSTRPGATTLPRTSRTSAPSGDPSPVPMAATFPSWTRTSAVWSKSRLGSITRPPLRSSDPSLGRPAGGTLGRVGELGASPGQQVEHGHAHRHAVRHLRENDAVCAVGDAGVDLHTAVHGSRVHDRELARCLIEPLGRDTEHAVVLAQARDESFFHAFQLQPEHVQHVGPLDRFLEAAEPADAELFDAAWHQGVGSTHADFGAEFEQPPDIRAGDARVLDVAHQADLQPGDLPVLVANREQIQQRLSGVLVLAVARVDDVGADAVAEKQGGTGRRMADHHHVDPHRLEVFRRVDERLPLLHGAAGRGHVHRVRRESFLGELEGDAGAGGGFEEEVDDRLAAERRDLLDGTLRHLLERLRGIEDEADLIRGEVLEPHQVLAEGGHLSPPCTSSTSSRPSSSCTSTSTRSPRSTFTCLPTTSGWIGSSRPPRSTSTHREIRLGRPKSASSSSAARTVRPVYSTSSTITTCLPARSPGIRVSPITGFGPTVSRSSRYSVMSRAPRGTATPSSFSISREIRSASSTPRRWMPIRTRSSVPWDSS